MKNFVTGANQDDYHFVNVNVGRDLKIDQVAGIRNAQSGERCPRCEKGVLRTTTGIEVGNTFMLGTKYSQSLGASFIDEDGKEKPFIMGSYGIGITRTAQAAVEKFHDEAGIIWPASIAPLTVEILPINVNDQRQREVAFRIYQEMTEKNVEVLIDDRDERAGVKFNDADLIGLPMRINVGGKSLKEGKIEIANRRTKEVILAKPEEAAAKCLELLGNL
jgi:prolyl-tRNA synthetase